MYEATSLIKASLEAGRELLRPPNEGESTAAIPRAAPSLVPIRSLGANHRAREECEGNCRNHDPRQ